MKFQTTTSNQSTRRLGLRRRAAASLAGLAVVGGAALLAAAGGVKPIPLMEDLDLVQRLRRHGRLVSLRLRLLVDGRRWRRLGIWGATLANARLRRAWRRGVDPEELARRYRAP